MANTQITPFQLTDQFTMDNFNQRINEINTALQNKAPAGFGLGESEQTFLDDCNNAVLSGWYSTINETLNTPRSNYSNGVLLVSRRYNKRIYQEWHDIAGDSYSGASASRITYGNMDTDTDVQWGPWEWITPPMQLGVEYRTTERYLGKPVYAKLVNFGALPNATSKSVSHGVSDIDKMVFAGGNAGDIYFPMVSNNNRGIELSVGLTTIYVVTTYDLSNRTGIVTMKYTKTTD